MAKGSAAAAEPFALGEEKLYALSSADEAVTVITRSLSFTGGL